MMMMMMMMMTIEQQNKTQILKRRKCRTSKLSLSTTGRVVGDHQVAGLDQVLAVSKHPCLLKDTRCIYMYINMDIISRCEAATITNRQNLSTN